MCVVQGQLGTSHVERDEAAGLTFNVVWDFTAMGGGVYSLFCIPDNENEEPFLLAKIQDEACYVHRSAAVHVALHTVMHSAVDCWCSGGTFLAQKTSWLWGSAFCTSDGDNEERFLLVKAQDEACHVLRSADA